jgi:8-oxo-dGTP diphosphatase
VLDRRFNKDSFRRRLLAAGQLEATGRRQSDVGHRPAELFRFRRADESRRDAVDRETKSRKRS